MAEKKMWGGRFRQKTAALVEEYTESVSYDKNLYKQDIAGSKAHARMLARQQVICQADADSIVSGLDAILKEIEDGQFQWKTEYEDVHMNIESRLSEIIGDAGKRLHTGRSRNDQVALDFRLYVSDSIREWQDLLKGVIAEIVKQAEEHVDTLLPGCTHMQPAQPVSLAHHLLAYAWMLQRDFDRLADCDKRARVCPLGAAALAGTTYPLDPASVAEELGMYGTFKNSMDAVSDRDFVLESLFDGSLIMTHLSRLNEELVYWANPNFGYIYLPDAYATGSSIMPQKKNPDVSEIMRGKVGRTFGSLINLLSTVKGLPMTYNRDMQEDKEPFIDTDKTVSTSLAIMAGMLSELRFNTKRMEEVLKQGFLNATELADYLVGKGVPFREAHHITGAAVALAEDKNKGLEDLSIEEFNTVSDLIADDVYVVLSYKNAVARRKTQGGTGPEAVRAQIAELNDWLS